MAKTINSSVTGPVTLAFPTDNPLTITSTGTVTSTGAGNDGVDGSGGAWTVGNSGTVSSGSADGFNLSGGATLTNNLGGVISSAGTVGGGLFVGAALYIRGGKGNVTNNGSISGGGYGAALAGGGSVTNSSSITGGEDAVRISGGAGTISNTGTITGSVDDAIGLFSGGSVTNASGATISSTGTAGAAVYATGGITNATNSGSVTASNHGFLIEAGGTVTNNAGASITVGNTGVFFKVQPGTVINSGNISGTGTSGTGVYLMNSGNISNTSTGTITGAVFGAFIEDVGGTSSNTLSNSGKISGASADGVVMGMGGLVTNNAGGEITGGSTGVYVKYRAAGTVTNSGSIAGTAATSTGVDLAGGGTLTNNVGGSITGNTIGVFSGSTAATGSSVAAISNAGNILGVSADGVDLTKGGSVTNLAGGTITGGSNGVYVNTGSSGTVTNNGGTITATSTSGAGVDLGGGGTVTNNSGLITGGNFGVFTTGAQGTVTNSASISGAHGVDLVQGGSITNNATGVITGQIAGVASSTSASSTVLNTGHITATAGSGADIEGGGSVTNASGGNITGSTFGVFMTGGASTVTNAGTISGTTDAVNFAGTAANRLIVDPGAVFLGNVVAAGSTNTLELASGNTTGSIGSIGTAFASFQTVVVDAGASWILTGANTTTSVLDAGSLDLAGTLNNAATIAFQGSGSQLLIDNASTFGSNVGTPSYTGPQLEDFVSGDKIDLKNISSAGATLSYNATTGLLQITNGASQAATLEFQNSSLGTGTFEAASDGSGGTLITLGASPPPPPPPPPAASTDVQWQNSANGLLAVWSMNGPQLAATNYVTFEGSQAAPGPVWSVAGLADFNGDGTNDFLWRNQNGSIVDWTMNGSQIAALQTVSFNGSPVSPGSNWSVAGLGDFNGDGKDDILWRNTNGTLVDWTMNGSQVAALQQVTSNGSPADPGSNWSIAGIGDFNGDGKADVLWRNINGTLVDWTMNGSQIASIQTVTLGGSAATPDSSWSVAAIGDFNGDGKADVLWRNTSGTLVDWTMNGSQITSAQQVTLGGNPVSLSSAWQIAQIGDFDKNGTSDILLRNTTSGTLEEWSMNGSQIASASQVTFQGSPAAPALTWNTLSKPTDFV
ncbi:MAG: VCBS repeat-containing protein [Hyphomicrobiales bacterium]|nr:VCBS repeat-containing protein [Hyphomicrobiales bacterium]